MLLHERRQKLFTVHAQFADLVFALLFHVVDRVGPEGIKQVLNLLAFCVDDQTVAKRKVDVHVDETTRQRVGHKEVVGRAQDRVALDVRDVAKEGAGTCAQLLEEMLVLVDVVGREEVASGNEAARDLGRRLACLGGLGELPSHRGVKDVAERTAYGFRQIEPLLRHVFSFSEE